MATVEQTADGTEPEPFQVQLQGLAFQGGTFATIRNGMPILAAMTEVALSPFYNAIFDARTGFAFGTSHPLIQGLSAVERTELYV